MAKQKQPVRLIQRASGDLKLKDGTLIEGEKRIGKLQLILCNSKDVQWIANKTVNNKFSRSIIKTANAYASSETERRYHGVHPITGLTAFQFYQIPTKYLQDK